METAKEQVQEILETLPEDASLEDIQYHFYVRQKSPVPGCRIVERTEENDG